MDSSVARQTSLSWRLGSPTSPLFDFFFPVCSLLQQRRNPVLLQTEEQYSLFTCAPTLHSRPPKQHTQTPETK
jgi:hypothetical protein